MVSEMSKTFISVDFGYQFRCWRFQRRLHWSSRHRRGHRAGVAAILARQYGARGDAAVLDYTARFDGLTADNMAGLGPRPTKPHFDNLPLPSGPCKTPPAGCASTTGPEGGLRRSYRDKTAPCWARRSHRWIASASMCPVAKAAYPSNLIMNAVPAHVAGVPEIIMVVPAGARQWPQVAVAQRRAARPAVAEAQRAGAGSCPWLV